MESVTKHKCTNKVERESKGATENAGVENAARGKMQGWKMQE